MACEQKPKPAEAVQLPRKRVVKGHELSHSDGGRRAMQPRPDQRPSTQRGRESQR